MELDAIVSYALTVTVMGVGLVVCCSCGLIAACWFMDRARERIMLSRSRWMDNSAIEQAVAEWKVRHQDQVERLERLRDKAGDWA